jgi:uncharacterized cupredoxin-like copper-binding protein
MRPSASLFLAAMILAGASGAQAQDWSRANRVEVDLWNFKIEPEAVDLQGGSPYVLHLVNQSDSPHDFTARAFFASAKVAPEDQGAVVDGKVELAPNSSRDIRLVAPAAGAYDVRCSRFLHDHLGMKSKITVR